MPDTNSSATKYPSLTETEKSPSSDLTPIARAARGKEITGLNIFRAPTDETPPTRIGELMRTMINDKPIGGTDIEYGSKDTQRLRLWNPGSHRAPIMVFVHGGSWRIGTYLDSVGSVKVGHLTKLGYAFASVNYTLIPEVTVEEQVQEVADSIAYIVQNATELDLDPERVVLMGHSSGAHVVTLLGTDTSYLERAGVSIDCVKGVISLDGSNYNAMAEISDSPGPIVENMFSGLGTDPERLRAMSPTYHARSPSAGAFLLLHVHRQGDVRQAVELAAALNAAGTDSALHVFEGESFEGHVQMLLRLGDPNYPATVVMDNWLKTYFHIA